MNKITKQELLSIPNLMGYFRILLIPIFVWIYCMAKSEEEYYIVALIIGISGLTDLLDGQIARRFNMITELGKFIDPLADKLTQGAIVICLTTRYKWMWIVVGLFIIKEGFMGIMGIIFLRKGKKLDGAMWFGKACTALMYIVMFILLLIPSVPIVAANGMIVLCAFVMAATLILYIPVFMNMWKQLKIKK